MANTYKNIVITPNRTSNSAIVPTIQFSGGDANTNTDIFLRTYTTSNGTLSFDGSAGQLFSITNDLSNSLFSVSDISGIPAMEIDANGLITMAAYYGNVAIGRTTAGYKLDVVGTINAANILINGLPIGGSGDVTTATLNGANTAVGSGANNFAVATFGGANNTPVGNTLASSFTLRSTRRTLNFIPSGTVSINVDDDSAGNRANITISATGGVGDVTTATLNGANTAVGAGANAFSAATIAGANTFMIAVQNGSNTAVGAGANAFSAATIAGANVISIAAFTKANAALANTSGITTAGPLNVSGTLTAANLTYTTLMTLPSGGGSNYIKAGNGDGASNTLYNLKINSWWGIGFGDYQDLTAVKIYMDTRSGHLGLNGALGVGTAASATTGEIRATNNITAYYSDRRLKTNIKPIENALEKINKISGVTFVSNKLAAEYGYNDKRTQVGVIAQEIESVLPEIVVPAPFDIAKAEDGTEYSKSGENYKTVQYEKIVPLLIEAIKEASAKIDSLTTEIKELKNR